MSSRRSQKRSASRRYPTQWGEWTWSDEYQRHYRSRLKSSGDYEFEYEEPSDTPRTAQEPSLGPTPLGPESYPQQQHYTTRTVATPEVDDLTQSLAHASMSSSDEPYSHHSDEVYDDGGGSNNEGDETYSRSDQPYTSVARSSSYLSNEDYTGATPYEAVPSYPGSNAPSFTGGPSYSIATPYASAPLSSAEAYISPTPTPLQNHIRTRDPYTDREEFDPHYKFHLPSAFKLGRVFKVLWTGPAGANASGSDDGTSSMTVRKGKHGEDIFANVRHFIIVKLMEGHCICLPILTYSGQGVNKRGVHAEHHAVIYDGKKPVAFRGEKEKGLIMRPIRVEPETPRHKLDDASRINYAKPYTVEYNVKAWFIGKVHKSSEWQLSTDFDKIHSFLSNQDPTTKDSSTKNSNTKYAAGNNSLAYPTSSTRDYSLHYPPTSYGSAYSTPGFDSADASADYEPDGKARAVDYDYDPTAGYDSAYSTVGPDSAYLDAMPEESNSKQTENLFKEDEAKRIGSHSLTNRQKADLEEKVAEESNLRRTENLVNEDEARRMDSRSMVDLRKDDREVKAVEEQYDISYRLDDRNQSIDPTVLTETDLKRVSTTLEGKSPIENVSQASVLALSEQVQISVLQTWPSSSAKSSQQALFYDIEWDPQSFLENHVKDPTKLGELVTITGEAVDAEALSCREYLARTYSDIGTLLLEGIELLLLHKSNLCVQNQAAKLEFKLTKDTISGKPQVSLVATTIYTTQIKIATAVSWMCASFQTSPHTEIMISSTLISTSESALRQGTSITIRPHVLVKPSGESCWHSLFPNRVIANGFPVRARSQGVGLELSFQNMAGASRCLSLVEYENGLIAHGLTLILVPMKTLDEDNAIQWHLEDKRKQKPYKLARISQVFSASPAMRERLKTLQAEELTGKRCFLGLAEHANVVIGTKAYQREFLFSRSPNAPKVASINSQSLTVESGFMGVFGGHGTYTRSSIPLQSTIQTRQELEIFDILDMGRENLAIFFDTTKNIGWLIPQVSVALQMTHAIISMYSYQIYDGSCKVPDDGSRAFAHSGPDAATEAANAVKRSLQLRIKRHHFSESESAFTNFGDMFERVWHTLSDIEIGLESAENGFRQAGHVAPKYIHGVEFLDAANLKPSIKIKYVKVDQAWAHLTSEQPLVILSRDIEPPIVPETSSLCRSWQLVPSKRSYLVSMGLAISSILERRSEGLADGLDWNFRKELIQFHKPGIRLPVKHAQKLVSRKKTRSNSPIRHQMLKYQKGCFVFGSDTDIECKEPILIRLKADTGHYVYNGLPHSTDLSSRSLDESAQTKSTPRIKSTLPKLFLDSQKEILPSKLLEQTESRTVGSGAADPDEYGDLYDA